VTVEMAREQGLLDIMNEPKEGYNGKLLWRVERAQRFWRILWNK
jgi:hypothetical protein